MGPRTFIGDDAVLLAAEERMTPGAHGVRDPRPPYYMLRKTAIRSDEQWTYLSVHTHTIGVRSKEHMALERLTHELAVGPSQHVPKSFRSKRPTRITVRKQLASLLRGSAGRWRLRSYGFKKLESAFLVKTLWTRRT